MEERRENIMGTQPINRLLPSMAFPIMLSMLVQALYNVVDSVFVSMVSENALTSVSLAFPVQNLMIAVSVGTAVGINALLSRRLGEKNFEAANKVAENGIFVTVLSWAVIAVYGAACSGLFMGAFTQNAEILAGGVQRRGALCISGLRRDAAPEPAGLFSGQAGRAVPRRRAAGAVCAAVRHTV